MTNKSINLIMSLEGKSKIEKELILREILSIEFKKIKAQVENFQSKSEFENELAKGIMNTNNSDELFSYLNQLSVIEISLLDAYGIDVSVMNLLKVSD